MSGGDGVMTIPLMPAEGVKKPDKELLEPAIVWTMAAAAKPLNK